MKFAIIGATGNVGRKTIDILEEKKKKGLEPTPAQTERLKRLKKNLLRQK